MALVCSATLAGARRQCCMSAALSPEQVLAAVREATNHALEDSQKRREYTYVERDEERTLDDAGRVQKTESTTKEILIVAGAPVERTVERDGRPLSPKEEAAENRRIQAIADERPQDADRAAKARARALAREDEHDREFMADVLEAFTFRFAGIEPVGDRPAIAIDAEPKPGFHPKSDDGGVLTKVRGRAWIDEADRHWARLDFQVIDTISRGVLLARLHKGSRLVAEQARFDNGAWLLTHESEQVDMRVALLKDVRVQRDETYSGYRKVDP